jgi:hypothetical protein
MDARLVEIPKNFTAKLYKETNGFSFWEYVNSQVKTVRTNILL